LALCIWAIFETGREISFSTTTLGQPRESQIQRFKLTSQGDDITHSILDMMYANAPYTVIQRAMRINPTVTELIPTTLGELKPVGVNELKNV
jgi:hypothetical protein